MVAVGRGNEWTNPQEPLSRPIREFALEQGAAEKGRRVASIKEDCHGSDQYEHFLADRATEP